MESLNDDKVFEKCKVGHGEPKWQKSFQKCLDRQSHANDKKVFEKCLDRQSHANDQKVFKNVWIGKVTKLHYFTYLVGG